MMTNRVIPQGISTASVRNIPEQWSAAWFRRFITAHLGPADLRNAQLSGINLTPVTVTGSPTTYAGAQWTPHFSVGSGVQPSPAGPFTPASVPGLTFWFDASSQLAPAGSPVFALNSPDPVHAPGYAIGPAANGFPALMPATVGVTPLNGRPVVTFPGAANSYSYVPATGQLASISTNSFSGVTIFVVHRPAAITAGTRYTFLGSDQSFYLGLGYLGTAPGVAEMQFAAGSPWSAYASSNPVISANTAFQANCQYNLVNGAYQFRIASAAQGSGTGTGLGLNTLSTQIGGTVNSNNGALTGDFAELLIYFNTLSLAQIQLVEAYLTSKWGV